MQHLRLDQRVQLKRWAVVTGKSTRRPSHRTQWAAQFAVASELCKLGYEAALTLGNHPYADLMVRSPTGTPFDIDVEGQYKKGFWVVSPKEKRGGLFYVLCHVPDRQSNEFFILTQKEMNEEVARHQMESRSRRASQGLAVDKVGLMPGIAWQKGLQFKDRWDALPK